MDREAQDQRTSPFSVYVHVPFCARRCGYCDFNTYTAQELSRDGTMVTQANYSGILTREIELAGDQVGTRPISTIFFGGGTPTLLSPEDIGKTLIKLEESFGFHDRIEITIEANPESVTRQSLELLRRYGVNRVSFGMQSAVPHVLETLDRTHSPKRLVDAVHDAKTAGFEHISVDLIYGTPGESQDDWRQSIDAALSLPIDHVSAYALIVEEGTKFSRKVERGEVVMPDEDETADKYVIAATAFESAGLGWYEVSNWSRPGGECRHNLAYWLDYDWWGFGPGAHSHLADTRWWNVKHPAAYAQRLAAGEPPIQDHEVLSAENREMERIMLGLRLRTGLAFSSLSQVPAQQALRDGYLDADEFNSGRVVLNLKGRLMADAVIRSLVP